jgi:thioesterase domain-containing protein
MSATIWLLPDFIGHPLCFSVLAARLEGRVRQVSYHRYWPYAGIADLARAVAEDWPGAAPDWIVGYSFGGLVGCELASLMQQRDDGAATRLLLVDSRLGSSCGGATALAQLVGSDAFSLLLDKIELLATLGEVDRDCVEANLRFFPDYRPPRTVRGATLIAGRPETAHYKSMAPWRAYLPDACRRQVDVAHQDMLTDSAALAAILSVLDARECA